MKATHTFILFAALILIAHSQLECQESRLQKIQSGEITLLPNDLGAAGANKNYIESLARGQFGPTDELGSAVAIAGFETFCTQPHFSLLVDIVEPQSENTKLKLIIDLRNKKGDSWTSWTRVKLSYLVVSAQRVPTGIPNAYIWATSQYVDLTVGSVSGKAIFTDPLFTSTTGAADDYTRGDGCGLIYDSTNKKYKFGIKCDQTSTNDGKVDKDVAIHSYLMGFQYLPDSGKTGHFMAATTKWNAWMNADTQRELAFYTDNAATNDRTNANYGITFKYDVATGGPIFMIDNFSGELQGIKIAIVMSVINPSYGSTALRNGFEASTLSYSYSGIYTVVNPSRYNFRSIIDNDITAGWNNLHQDLPVNKYMIYGLSSFQLKDGSDCKSFSLDVSIDTVSTYIVKLNQASYVENVVIQADVYFPQTIAVCSPIAEFNKVGYTYNAPNLVPTAELNAALAGTNGNLRNIKVKSSEKYSETPSDETFKSTMKITSSPLQLNFLSKSKTGIKENVKFNAQINLTGLLDGKSYGFNFIMVPATTRVDQQFPDPVSMQTYDFEVSFNGFRLFKKSYKGDELQTLAAKPASIADWEQHHFGMNVKGTTGTLVINIVVPRDPIATSQMQTYTIIMNIFQFLSIYDPVTQCCVPKCPPNTGLDVSVTPVACVVCDVSKGLAYDPSTASCKCADGNYLNDNIGFQCFPCQTKLCSQCNPAKPTICRTCMTGASLNIFDSTCKCSSGFYEINGTCMKCPAKCATCTVSSSCDTCSDTNRNINNNCSCITGFYDAGIDKCASCNPSCVSCDNATTCSSCDARLFRVLQSGLCVCRPGYFELIFENSTRVCQKCSSECKTCAQSATECTSCDGTINRIDGYDSLGHRTCICKAGFRALSDSSCIQSNCKSDKWCSECETDLALCIQCQATAKRVLKTPEHICVCQDGFYEAQDGTCKPCGEGCAKCSSATKCDVCVPQATSNSNGNCTCANGLYIGAASNGLVLCISCAKYCDKCSQALSCQSCKAGFQLAVDNNCICPRNFFINSKDECVPCKTGCEVCNSNTTCSKCISPLVLQNNTCITKCSQGYYLEGGKCVGCPSNCLACTSNNKCFYCKDGTFLQGGACYNACPAGTIPNKQTFQCIACNAPCKTCVNHPSSCTSCEPGEGYLQFNANASSCVKECAEGTFPRNGVCEVCDFRCARCLGSASNCIACPVNTFLYNGACWDYCPGIMSNGLCMSSCPTGYYKVNDRQCKQCSSQCSTCDSNSTCLTCANNLLSLNGRCVRNCTEGYYAFRGMCVACDRSCKTCSMIPTQCRQCADGYIMANGRCVKSCAEKTYIDVVSKTCRPCHPSCRTCSSELNCLTCPNENIIPIGGQCLSCIYPCAECSKDLSQCFSCQSGFYLSNGDCLRTCPGNTRPVNGVCSCSSGIFLDGSCVSACPSGFTKVGTQCKRCQSPCVECSGTTKYCTDCLDTFTLNRTSGRCEQRSTCNYGQYQIENGKCQRVCPAGFYLSNGVCMFGKCPDGFKDNGLGGCISSSISTSLCEVPTYKQNNVCVERCSNATFPNVDTRTCESCSSRCQSCLSKDYCFECVSGFVSLDGRCVTQAKCVAPKVSDNGECVDSCQAGMLAINGRCSRRCPQGSFFYNGWCYITCPIEAPLFTDSACVTACPQGTVNIDGVCATLAI